MHVLCGLSIVVLRIKRLHALIGAAQRGIVSTVACCFGQLQQLGNGFVALRARQHTQYLQKYYSVLIVENRLYSEVEPLNTAVIDAGISTGQTM